LRLAPFILSLLSFSLFGGITAFVLLRTTASGTETVNESIAPDHSAIAVVTERAVFAQWQDTIETSGVIAPWQEAVINAQIEGYQIIEIRADVGDVVHKGQVLAVLNQEFLHVQRDELQAKWDKATADLKRASALSAKGNMSEKDLLQVQTEEKIAKALLEQKLLEIKYATVTAPDAGVIVSRSALLGQVGQLGTELFRINRQSRLEWRAELAASDLKRVSVGQKVEVDLPDGEVVIGVIRMIAPTLDEATRRGLIYADITEGSMARAGMYSGGRILLGLRQALIVPAASLLVRDGRHYAARLSGSEQGPRVELVPVDIGRYSGDRAEVMDGLSPSDTIVGQGAGLLNDGDRVRVVQAASRE
jgi:RND family efflux transporter MFP subunit